MINLLIGTVFGILIGASVAVFASDPCEWYEPYKEERYKFDKPNKDAALEFHWQDHQPSLHPR